MVKPKKLTAHDKRVIDKMKKVEIFSKMSDKHYLWLDDLILHSLLYYNSPISHKQRKRLIELKWTYLKKK